MSKSERVTAAQELAAVRLVNECRETGDDTVAWQGRLVAGLLRLTGGRLAAVSAAPPHVPDGKPLDDWVTGQVGDGWPSAAVKARWERGVTDPEWLASHPAVWAFLFRPEPVLSVVRRELVGDREWDGSGFVNDFMRPDGFDEGLAARTVAPSGAAFVVTVMRATGERPYPVRVGRQVAAVLRELAPHLGRTLWLTHQPSRAGLSPRLRATLDCLLDGDGEKQVAARLGIPLATVHDRVKRLYRHFGVESRSELMAYFLRRTRPA